MTALLPCLALAVLTQAGPPQPPQPSPGVTPRPVRPPSGAAPPAARPTPAQATTPGTAPPPGRQTTQQPSLPPAGEGTTSATTPNCSEVRKKARYNIYFDKVDIEKLVQTVSDAT